MISVKNLSHSYSEDENLAVKNISFEVENGETFGFLGPSGAGKSTTQGVLTGLLKLQAGEVFVAGYDIRKVQKERFNKIGVSFEQSNVYGKLTARENLEYYAKLFDVPTRDPSRTLVSRRADNWTGSGNSCDHQGYHQRANHQRDNFVPDDAQHVYRRRAV